MRIVHWSAWGSGMLAALGVVACSDDNDLEAPEPSAETQWQALGIDQVRDAVLRQAPGAQVSDNKGVFRLYGGSLARGSSHRDSASEFINKHAQALGTTSSDLQPVEVVNGAPVVNVNARPLGLMLDPATGQYKFYLYRYGQVRSGVRVFDSDVRVLVRNSGDNPVVWSASTAKNLAAFAPTSGMRTPTPNQTKSLAALRGFTGPSGQRVGSGARITSVAGAEVTIFAGSKGVNVAPHMAVQYTVETENPPGKWSVVARADNGDVEHVESLVVTAPISGRVTGKVTSGARAMNCAEEVSTPFADAEVSYAGGTPDTTDESGQFVLNAGLFPVTLTSAIGGTYFDVTDFSGANEVLTQSVAPPRSDVLFEHNPLNASDELRAQSNGYVHATQARNFLLRYIPDYPTIATQRDFPVKVNRTGGFCPGNAWYDGASINFCKAGSSGGVSWANSAFASVTYHEYGHHIVTSGGSGQGEYGEGMSDVVAALLAREPGLFYGMSGECSVPDRSADNNCQFSETSCSSCGSEVHACGELLSGIIWDIREQLAQTEPLEYEDLLNALVLSSIPMHSGGTIDSAIATDLLTLDDDDGLLGNGTPHDEEICNGFEAHGITCPVVACQRETGPSCANTLACGSGQGESCCTAKWVDGGSFYRGTTLNYPATVSGFCMDKYEVTVGRFREFTDAYDKWEPVPGDGAHAAGAGTGWRSEWGKGRKLPSTAKDLIASLKSTSIWDTWRDQEGDATAETLPINYVDWYTAFAFCLWDGGRLPTEAEWEYAAGGGSLERSYPWGNSTPTGSLAVMNFCGNDNSCDYPNYAYSDIVPVGSKQPQGDGLWGHSDLTGSMIEWLRDHQSGLAANYLLPCNDCVDTTVSSTRRTKSSTFGAKSNLQVSYRTFAVENFRWDGVGIRCVRMPPDFRTTGAITAVSGG